MTKRMVIYISDVQIIIGKGYKAARNTFMNAKKFFGKKKHQALTVEEFCDYMGLDFEKVKDRLPD